MSIELPKDAEGREIPLDTVVLFGGNDNAYNITGWIYVTDFDLSNSMAGQWRALTDKFTRLDPELMHLTPSDSWEKLLEDLGEAGNGARLQPVHEGEHDAFRPLRCALRVGQLWNRYVAKTCRPH